MDSLARHVATVAREKDPLNRRADDGYGARVRFTGELFRWNGDAPWYFITVPLEVAEPLSDSVVGPRAGFGSIRVSVRIGDTGWATSVFPQKDGTYLLPVKKAVRAAEDLDDGDQVTVELDPAGS